MGLSGREQASDSSGLEGEGLEDGADLIERDGVDTGELLLEREVLAQVGPEAAKALHASAGAFAGEGDAGGETVAEALEVVLGE
jgi:hypothetical protein